MALASLVSIIFLQIHVKNLVPQIYQKPEVSINQKRVLKFILLLTVASIASIILSSIDSLVLAFFVQPTYVGYYKAAFTLVSGIISFASFPTIVLLPFFTKLKKEDTNILFNKILRYIALISIPSTFGLIALGNYIIRFFCGYDYLPAVYSLYPLAFIIFPAVTVYLILTLFSAEEKPQLFVKAVTFTCIINLILNLVLIKIFLNFSELWATVGVGIATFLSWFFYFVYSFSITKRNFAVKINSRSLINSTLASIIMWACLYLILKLINDMSAILGVLMVVIGVLVYFVALYLFGELKREDLDIFKVLIK